MTEARSYFAHPHALVETDAIGDRTRVWAFAHILGGAAVGADCNICDHVFIESDVVVGDRVTVKSGVQLWNGVRLEDDVFVGPNATFTNDPFPRSRVYDQGYLTTTVEQNASIGANATILPGIRIGRNAMVGAGTVVTSNVPANAIVVGNPSRIAGYVDSGGRPSPKRLPKVDDVAADVVLGRRGVRVITWAQHSDLRGSLAVLEQSELPFQPQRIFTVYAVPSKEVRGEHAHRRCDQLLTCVAGSVQVLWDDGVQRGQILLDDPHTSMYMPAMVWGSQFQFSADAVLLVLASRTYENSDYIRTYEEFMSLAG